MFLKFLEQVILAWWVPMCSLQVVCCDHLSQLVSLKCAVGPYVQLDVSFMLSSLQEEQRWLHATWIVLKECVAIQWPLVQSDVR